MTQSSRWCIGVVVVSAMSWLSACSSDPFPKKTASNDAHRAAQVVQDREKELAAARAEVAATRIAAAKQAAELSALRTLVAQLRQENGESHQALRDAQGAGEAVHMEVAALKAEREDLLKKTERQHTDMAQVATLQETVATLSRELGELRGAMVSSARVVAGTSKPNIRMPAGPQQERRPTEPSASSPPRRDAASAVMVPAVHVLKEAVGIPDASRVTVQPGDTLWSLARRHKTTVEALRAANELQGDQVMAGQELTLP